MRIILVGLFLLALALPAVARMAFADYSNLTPEEQKAWGYKVTFEYTKDYAALHLVIPPEAAALYRGSRITFQDKQKNLLAGVDGDMIKGKDGSLTISIQLNSPAEEADLVIDTGEVPGVGKFFDFGGLTFHLATKP